jgi:hypothetical protein
MFLNQQDAVRDAGGIRKRLYERLSRGGDPLGAILLFQNVLKS